MHTTKQILDVVNERHHFSDYRLAKIIGVSPQVVSNWRNGRNGLSVNHAIKVADLLDWPHAYVVACVKAEHEEDGEAMKVWESIAEAFASKAAAVILSALALYGGSGFSPENTAFAAQGGIGSTSHNNVYYVNT